MRSLDFDVSEPFDGPFTATLRENVPRADGMLYLCVCGVQEVFKLELEETWPLLLKSQHHGFEMLVLLVFALDVRASKYVQRSENVLE